jgi:glycine cleavage system transcriptional repressor
MSKKYILTAFSKDRPGIVADITRLIYEHNCNLEESAMAKLSGEFALIFLFSPLSGNNGDDLEEFFSNECRRLERDKGITAFVRRVADQDITEGNVDFELATITVEGLDHAGIVYKISSYLAEKKINISSLNSEVKSSPESGAAIYSLVIKVEIPRDLNRQEIETGLRQRGDELLVDIAID